MKALRESLLPRLSVERPTSVIMALFALLVVGFIAYTRISVSMWPGGFEGKWLGFWTPYQNANPTDVERTITRRIEEALSTLPRVERIWTGSFTDGVWTSIRFLPGTDMTQAYGDLWERLHRVAPELPEISRKFWVRRWDPDDNPLVWTSAAFPEGIERPFDLLDKFLKPYLLRVDGVAQVEIWGAGHREVQVQMDLERMRRHGVEAPELVRSMQDLNLAMPSGFVRDGGRKLYVRSVEVLNSIDKVQTTTVDWDLNLKLEDLATVKLEQKNWRSSRLDRKEALYVVIWREAGANMVEVSRAILAALDEVSGRPELRGANIKVLDDLGARVTEAIDNLKSSGLWGGLFAAIVLFLFLRTVSMTLVITMAIPLSILSVIVVLYFLDWSLNLATMMGLMLSLGLVVDNAIVIVENIYRKRRQGVAPRAASVEGASEVALAVTMATLTTIVVFLPLILMSDDEHLAFLDAASRHAGDRGPCGFPGHRAGHHTACGHAAAGSGIDGSRTPGTVAAAIRPEFELGAAPPGGHLHRRGAGAGEYLDSDGGPGEDGQGSGVPTRHLPVVQYAFRPVPGAGPGMVQGRRRHRHEPQRRVQCVDHSGVVQ